MKRQPLDMNHRHKYIIYYHQLDQEQGHRMNSSDGGTKTI